MNLLLAIRREAEMSIHPIILCGGSGTRLWPLSRKSFPKQFVPLIHGKSLLHLTMSRLAPLRQQITCVASDAHRFLVADAMDQFQSGNEQIFAYNYLKAIRRAPVDK